MLFLGTGAADMIPNAFCTCAICARARRERGRLLKRRSSLQLDAAVLIDLGPDAPAAALELGADLTGTRHILFTHTHDDHLSFSSLGLLSMSRTAGEEPIHLYLSAEGVRWCAGHHAALLPDALWPQEPRADGAYEISLGGGKGYVLHPVRAGETFQLDGKQVLAVPTHHKSFGEGEYALNYRITLEDGRRVLYASDTGVYGERALGLLCGERLDVLILECTFGSRVMEEGCGHLDAQHFVQLLQAMGQQGILDARSRVFSTHLNHKHAFHPEDLQAYFDEHAPLPVQVAYDGLAVD